MSHVDQRSRDSAERSAPRTPDPALADDVVPVLSWGHTDHWHQWGEVLAVVAGDVVARFQDGSERHVTEDSALWLPAACVHAVRMSEDAVLLPVITGDDGFDATLPPHPIGIAMTGALRRAVTRQLRAQLFDSPECFIPEVLDEVRASLDGGSSPALPRTGAARRVAQALLADPASHTSLSEWANLTFTSEATLRRAFVDETGMTFTEWLRRVRLARSRQLLDRGTPVAAVASKVGYGSTSAFIAAFRREFGHTPGRHATAA
ncbi:AraC family transcriptional regulator [Demequina sp. NBRC 110057]|uniref:helix-turn-helix transcriptional regulator n=1 Tax=Demequina sp. NBRC 110057 TaxID=1570346 RepID=UPI00190EC17F|nr:AraC family transcriptional regulator [Demequina sp. NBRC 110057]